jgi:hypothetical protein
MLALDELQILGVGVLDDETDAEPRTWHADEALE